MSTDTNQISQLIFKYVMSSITDDEYRELMAWVGQSKQNSDVFRRLTDMRHLQMELHRRRAIDTSRPLADMQARIVREFCPHHGLRRFVAYVASVAAGMLLAVGVTAYIYNNVNESQVTDVVAGSVAADSVSHGTTKAVLTLDDGRCVALGTDSLGNAKAISNVMAAASSDVDNPAVAMLNLETPRGGEFKVTLEDGTEVWLNAQSQLRYPESFGDSERHVQLEGEAYFKVAKDRERPFIVESAGQLVRVMGTEFNINSYRDDTNVYTTLVSGSVALKPVDSNSGELVLTPGHQAVFDKNDEHATVRSVDTGVVTSWRSGSFVFENQTLEQIMITLSRWYDFEYEFKDASVRDIVFMGSVPRYGEFSDVLHILEMSGNIRLKLTGRHLEIRLL